MFQFPANPVIDQQFSPIAGITYQWNGTGWVHIGNTPASVYPPGVIVPYAGNVIPIPFQGWVFCDGASYATAAQPLLFAAIGYTYGGAGANFNVPDLRGRAIFGRDDMGGTPANRVTTAGSGINGVTLGAAGGAEAVALSAAQLGAHAHAVTDPGHGHGISDPTHTHGVTDPGHTHPINGAATAPASGSFVTSTNNSSGNFGNTGTNSSTPTINGAGTGIGVVSGPSNVTTQNAGGGQTHQNVPPAIILNYIIKT